MSSLRERVEGLIAKWREAKFDHVRPCFCPRCLSSSIYHAHADELAAALAVEGQGAAPVNAKQIREIAEEFAAKGFAVVGNPDRALAYKECAGRLIVLAQSLAAAPSLHKEGLAEAATFVRDKLWEASKHDMEDGWLGNLGDRLNAHLTGAHKEASNACALCGLPAVALLEVPACYRHTELRYAEERKAAALPKEESRSVQRRVALQKGETMPTFEGAGGAMESTSITTPRRIEWFCQFCLRNHVAHCPVVDEEKFEHICDSCGHAYTGTKHGCAAGTEKALPLQRTLPDEQFKGAVVERNADLEADLVLSIRLAVLREVKKIYDDGGTSSKVYEWLVDQIASPAARAEQEPKA